MTPRFAAKIDQYAAEGTTIRLAISAAALAAAREAPILGAGSGQAKEVVNRQPSLQDYYESHAATGKQYSVHSNYLMLLLDVGLAGFLTFLLFAASWLRDVTRQRQLARRQSRWLDRMICGACLSSFISWLVMGLSAGSFGMNYIWLTVAIPMAIRGVDYARS